MDITPVFQGKKVNHIEEFLIPGKLISMKAVDVNTGGAIANTGVSMKLPTAAEASNVTEYDALSGLKSF